MGNSLFIWVKMPYMWQIISFLLLSRFPHFCSFDFQWFNDDVYNASQCECLCVFCTWSYWSPWMCIFRYLSNLGSFDHSFFKNSFGLFFLSLWNSYNLIFRLAVFHWPIFTFTESFVCSVCCWKSLVKILFQLLYLQIQNFYLVHF